MSKKSTCHKSDPVSVKEKILANRQSFISYNIARLRALIRYFPNEKLELFYSIPLLLHANSPDLPGYVDHPETPHGVYRFFDSGFWKLAKKRLNIESEAMPSFILRRSCIRGLYLVGNCGTLGQTDDSDLNYWVVIDRRLVSETQQGLLEEKLARIKDWSKETYDHNVTFFALDVEQMRRNDFSGMDKEGAGALQQGLLKEEFYRTVILIAGQIPYWAVLPPGLKDAEYKAWIEAAGLLSDHDFVADDYVDLGNLVSITNKACLGGLIWEISRAQDDPVEALIKASLICYHHFFQEQEGLLCDFVKKIYPESRLDSDLLDPHVHAFESAVRFYESIDDEERLDLIRQCVYLRLAGYPVPRPLDEKNAKGLMLKHYVRAWSWSEHQSNRLGSYGVWTEDEKLKLENRITSNLFFLYELVSRSAGKLDPFPGMEPEALAALKNRRKSHFKTEPGKLPYGSYSLRAERAVCTFRVARRQDSSGAQLWVVYQGLTGDSGHGEVPLFVSPELLRVLGWVVLNRLCKNEPQSIVFQNMRSLMSAKRAQQLLEELMGFFSNKESSGLSCRDPHPRWRKVFVALAPGLVPSDRVLRSMDYLVQNTWGEMFLFSLDIGHIENDLLKCYEIAKCVWHYIQGTVPGESEYRIHAGRTLLDGTTIGAIEDFIQSFREADHGGPKVRDEQRTQGIPSERKRSGPLIDLL